MSLFKNDKASGTNISQRQVLESRYATARNNILLVVALTLINIVLLVTNANTYFLFSAYIPFFLVDLSMLLCGMYPADFYTGDFAGMEFLPKEFLVITLVIAAVILVLYLLSWVFSKKQKVGWLTFALILFGVDTLAMLLFQGFMMESILDYVIHAWVIFSFISGITAFSKLKKLPEETEVPIPDGAPVSENTETSEDPGESAPAEDSSQTVE